MKIDATRPSSFTARCALLLRGLFENKGLRYHFLFSLFSILLSPFSLIFGTITTCRRKWVRSETLPVPTICVGNLRIGGTGKTPLVEYIVNFLSQHFQTAILSRGYGRKTKGYINAKETSYLSSQIIGDEPMQYFSKFPNVEIAVCKKRKTGIQNLLKKNPKLKGVVLDDAYQHLSVNYSLRILLTEYHRPFFKDFPIPSGRLREFRCAAKYADIIIVTKCPNDLTQENRKDFILQLKPKQHQEVFFTTIHYAESRRAEGKNEILLVTGIDNPKPLLDYLEGYYGKINRLHFPDHHSFTKKDIEKIIKLKEKLGGDNCIIFTTEKDAMRLQAFENMPEFQTIPIEIAFLENESVFQEKLLSLFHRHEA